MTSYKKIFHLTEKLLQKEKFLSNAQKLYAVEKDPGYENFARSAAVCVQALKEAGFSDIESISIPCDGVTSFMDHTMPQAWDRTGRCTLEIINRPEIADAEKLLCDSNRNALEAGIWSPPTPPEGICGEVITGETVQTTPESAAGKYVFITEPPKNLQMISWSKANAAGVVCTKMEAADFAPDELCWMNGVGHYGWYYSKGDKRIPVFVLTPRRAEFLQRLLASGPVQLRGVMNTRIYDGDIQIITGRIPGESPQELMLMAHIYEPFIADDAVGFAGSVEIGRLLKELEQLGKFRLKRSLRVVFTMERYGFFAYLSDPKRAKKIFAAQNMDAFCSKTYSIGGMPLSFFMSPVCNPFFGDVLQKKMLDTLLPDVKYRWRHSVLHDDSLGGDPDLDIPTLWIEEGTGKYHHNKHRAFNEIDEDLAPRILALLTAYCAVMLSSDASDLRHAVTPYITAFAKERIRDVSRAWRAKEIDSAEAEYRLKLIHHFASGRLRSFNKLQSALVSAAECKQLVNSLPGLLLPASPLPDLTPWEVRADNMFIKRCQKADIPFSFARIPHQERQFWQCATNRLLLPLSNGRRSLLEVMKMQRFSENPPAKPFTKAELQQYIAYVEYLEKYGYVTIDRPGHTTPEDFARALKKLGVTENMQLIVHTGLASFGRFDGGPQEYCRTIMDAIGKNGTLMMPAFNQYDMSDTNGVFDWKNTVSKVGAVTEFFRNMPGVVRSLDPTHSVAVWGRNKIDFIRHHHQLPAMHRNSPIGLLEQAGGYCLLAGCRTAVTFRHVVETSLKCPCCGQRTEEYGAILPDGSRSKLRAWAWMNGSCRAIRHGEIYSWLQKNGKIREIMLGNAHLRLFKLSDYRAAYERLLKGKNGCRGCEVRPRQNEFSVPGDWDTENDCLKPDSTAFTGEIDWEKYC